MYMNDRRSYRRARCVPIITAVCNTHGSITACLCVGQPINATRLAFDTQQHGAWSRRSLCTHKWHEHVVDLALQGPGSTSSAHGPSMRATHISLGVTWELLGSYFESAFSAVSRNGLGGVRAATEAGGRSLDFDDAIGAWRGGSAPPDATRLCPCILWRSDVERFRLARVEWRRSACGGRGRGGTLAREWPNGAPDVSWQLCLTWCGIIWFMR